MHCTSCGEQISDKAEVCPKCGVRPFREKNYCNNCGAKVNDKQEICIECGFSLKKIGTVSGTSMEPWLAALISLLITGLGQIILGQVKKGAVILVVSIILGTITIGLSSLITIPIAVIDAYMIAKKKKDGKVVGEWEFF